ncbi:MAG: HRDC domain-containing protein [Planctomycetes bacterium]|nr:HRDC domain-containing protein [Planctomycetota bacterium]
MSVEFTLIDNEATFHSVLKEFETQMPDKLAIDTEFIPEKTYIPILSLLQVCANNRIFLFDPIKLDLKPLAEYFENAEIIFHSGAQDLFLLENLFEIRLDNYFDTQIAASLVSCSGKRSYADLCMKYLNIEINKGETLTKWDKRPLNGKQLRYAANDVIHLFPLYRRLTKKIEAMGRSSWVNEEFDKLRVQVGNLCANENNFLKIKHLWKLKIDEVGIARELYYWRETRAIEKNQKPKQILSDHQLIQIAHSRPENLDDLSRLRSIPKKMLEIDGEHLLELILKGYESEITELPEKPANNWLTPEQKISFEFMELVIRLISIRNKVSDIFLTEGKILNKLIKAKKENQFSEFLDNLNGWRGKLLRPYFKAFLDNDIILKPTKNGNSLEVIINGKKNTK